MKYIIILSVILFSCSAQKYVVQDARIEIKRGKLKITRLGPSVPIGDTVIICKMVMKK